MPPHLPKLPTLRQFLAAAQSQGCDVRQYRARTIVENPRIGIPVVIPQMHENEQLTQFLTEYLSRILQVQGFTVDETTLLRQDWVPSTGEKT